MPQLLTDWLTLGTAGPTVDGREIPIEDIEQAAKNYDPDNYCAVINIDHNYGNLGTVHKTRLNKDKQGRSCLQGRLRPNEYYLYNNTSDHKLFFSMEITKNFAGTGEAYLTGLAATDAPASLGTTCARFSKEPGNIEKYVAEPVELKLTCSDADEASIMDSMKAFFKKHLLSKTETPTEEFPMTPEQLKSIVDGQSAATAAIEKLSTNLADAVAKFTAKPEAPKTPEVPAPKTTETPKAPEVGAFDAVIKPLTEKFDALAKKLDDALAGKNGTTTTPAEGEANEFDGII